MIIFALPCRNVTLNNQNQNLRACIKISLRDKADTQFIFYFSIQTLLKILIFKEFEIFLWKKRRFRLRWDSSRGLSIVGRLLQTCGAGDVGRQCSSVGQSSRPAIKRLGIEFQRSRKGLFSKSSKDFKFFKFVINFSLYFDF